MPLPEASHAVTDSRDGNPPLPCFPALPVFPRQGEEDRLTAPSVFLLRLIIALDILKQIG